MMRVNTRWMPIVCFEAIGNECRSWTWNHNRSHIVDDDDGDEDDDDDDGDNGDDDNDDDDDDTIKQPKCSKHICLE